MPDPSTMRLHVQIAELTARLEVWRAMARKHEAAAIRARQQIGEVVIVKRNVWPDSPEQLAEESARREAQTWANTPPKGD